jgi:hypothetical protein
VPDILRRTSNALFSVLNHREELLENGEAQFLEFRAIAAVTQ